MAALCALISRMVWSVSFTDHVIGFIVSQLVSMNRVLVPPVAIRLAQALSGKSVSISAGSISRFNTLLLLGIGFLVRFLTAFCFEPRALQKLHQPSGNLQERDEERAPLHAAAFFLLFSAISHQMKAPTLARPPRAA